MRSEEPRLGGIALGLIIGGTLRLPSVSTPSKPWRISFTYGWALQDSALGFWLSATARYRAAFINGPGARDTSAQDGPVCARWASLRKMGQCTRTRLTAIGKIVLSIPREYG
jgi:hypothetical protein